MADAPQTPSDTQPDTPGPAEPTAKADKPKPRRAASAKPSAKTTRKTTAKTAGKAAGKSTGRTTTRRTAAKNKAAGPAAKDASPADEPATASPAAEASAAEPNADALIDDDGKKTQTPLADKLWRLAAMVVFSFVAYLVFLGLVLGAAVQFVVVLLKDEPYGELQQVMSGLKRYMTQLVAYLAYETDDMPYPFDSFWGNSDSKR